MGETQITASRAKSVPATSINELSYSYKDTAGCPHFSIQRQHFLKQYFYRNPSTIKQMQLFQSKGELLNLCKFVSVT